MRLFWCAATSALAAAILSSAVGTAERPDDREGQPPALPDALLKQTRPIFDGKSLDGWAQIPADSWEVKDGAMASTGAGRGVIYTRDDYARSRLVFVMRHVSGKPDHQACVLIFCTRPQEGEKALD